MTVYHRIDSPLGTITLQANDSGLLGVWFMTQTTQPVALGAHTPDHPIIELATQQLTEYFQAGRRSFSVPIAAKGTDFQRRVWQALTTINFGETWSYQDLAHAIGQPSAARAVGMANGKNPISIIVPCHRVIGKKGTLTGYAGGVERKAWLLKHEGILAI
jgi:methylated-DNA-[protein]-cysteine S-methyltransferase